MIDIEASAAARQRATGPVWAKLLIAGIAISVVDLAVDTVFVTRGMWLSLRTYEDPAMWSPADPVLVFGPELLRLAVYAVLIRAALRLRARAVAGEHHAHTLLTVLMGWFAFGNVLSVAITWSVYSATRIGPGFQSNNQLVAPSVAMDGVLFAIAIAAMALLAIAARRGETKG